VGTSKPMFYQVIRVAKVAGPEYPGFTKQKGTEFFSSFRRQKASLFNQVFMR
jgi:hypothetical protein